MVDHYDENRENWDDNYKKDECPGDEMTATNVVGLYILVNVRRKK